MVAIGDECPDFQLPDDSGGTTSLAGLKGKPFVLYFYPKDDTSGCTLEAIDFSRLGKEFEAIGVPVLGVSPDSVKQHCKFRDKHSLSVRLLADEERSLIEAFGLWIEKSMYGRTYMGVDRSTYLVGADGRIAEAWPKVKVQGHAEEVLRAATRLSGAA